MHYVVRKSGQFYSAKLSLRSGSAPSFNRKNASLRLFLGVFILRKKNRPESELFNDGLFIKINAMMGKAIKY
ncbi:hypothetical protein BG55_19670 [Erwinia mallotivora]|uniref:Uncharacterized protein n=1 Tax=Erwinia mallotivora TaxID=69222 RepID=A0A014NJP2_9GAMM|nr:hypothetical protein BG55_19670 [Erwinia mallotivora]